MNIPLDARTPSYSDCGDSAQANMGTVWDPDFWSAYFDAMVSMRFNVLSLWAPHPFPSLTRVPEYPDIGYDDVAQADLDWRWFNPQCDRTGANIGTAPAVLGNLTTLIRMPLDEKIAFWQNVTARAASLGIQVYWITWSVFTGEAGHGMPDVPNNITADYVRSTTRAFLRTYPHIAGLGVTAGENMTVGDDEKEAWLWAGYGQGVNDAMAADPGRQLTFLHRVWETEMAPIEYAFRGLDPAVNLDFSFKYCAARCYTTAQPQFWAQANLSLPAGAAGGRSRFWWTLRNDDVFTYRWGDVGFLRSFIQNLPPANITRGFWFGSDGYVWAREFTSLRPSAPARRLEVDKHWLAHTAWGLLGYDPTTPAPVFAALAAARYPEAPSPAGPYMLSLSAAASSVVQTINQFFWQDWDVGWNAEICSRSAFGVPSDTSFVTVLDFAGAAPLQGSGMTSIAEWVKGGGGNASSGISPLQVALGLEGQANATIAAAGAVRPGTNVELQETLGDYLALAHLGLYYARKIRGAALAALYVAGGRADPALQAQAVAELQAGALAWQGYAGATYAQYARQAVFARVGVADLGLLQAEVEADVALRPSVSASVVQQSGPGACSPPTSLTELSEVCDAIGRDRPFAVVGPAPAGALGLVATALGGAGIPVLSFAPSPSDADAAATGDAPAWRTLVRIAPPEDVLVQAVAAAVRLFGWSAITLVKQDSPFGHRSHLALSRTLGSGPVGEQVSIEAALSFYDAPSAAKAAASLVARTAAAGSPLVALMWADDVFAPVLFSAAAAAGAFATPLITWVSTSAALPSGVGQGSYRGLLVVRPSARAFAGPAAEAAQRSANAAALLASWPAPHFATRPASVAALDPSALALADSILAAAAALREASAAGSVTFVSDSFGSFVSWKNSTYGGSVGGCLDAALQPPKGLSPLSAIMASATTTMWAAPSSTSSTSSSNAAAAFPFVTGPLAPSASSRGQFFNSTRTPGAPLSRAVYTLELANVQASGSVAVAMLYDSATNAWSGSSNDTLTWAAGEGSVPPPDGSNLRGVRLRVLMPVQAPFVVQSADGTVSGLAVDVLRAVSELAAFSYTISVADSSLSYDDIVRQVALGNADLVIGDVTITEARQNFVDFSSSFFSNSVRLVIKRPKAVKPPLLAFLRPFSPSVWFAWCGSIAFTAVLTAFFEAGVNEALPLSPESNKDPSAIAGVAAQALFFSVHANLGGGMAFEQMRFASKASVLAVMFASMILLATYTGAVSAALTAGLSAKFLSSLSQIASGAYPAARVGVMQGDSTEPLFREFVSPAYFRAGTSYGDQLPNLLRGAYDATVGDQASLGYLVATQFCDLVVVGEPYWPSTFGWVMPKSWPRTKKDAINLAILRLIENGDLQKFQDTYYKSTTCPPFDPSTGPGGETDGGTVTLDALGGVFQVLIYSQLIIAGLFFASRFVPEWLVERVMPGRRAEALRKAAEEEAAAAVAPVKSDGQMGGDLVDGTAAGAEKAHTQAQHHRHLFHGHFVQRHDRHPTTAMLNPMLMGGSARRSAVRDLVGGDGK